jgi:hypothetical protein
MNLRLGATGDSYWGEYGTLPRTAIVPPMIHNLETLIIEIEMLFSVLEILTECGVSLLRAANTHSRGG